MPINIPAGETGVFKIAPSKDMYLLVYKLTDMILKKKPRTGFFLFCTLLTDQARINALSVIPKAINRIKNTMKTAVKNNVIPERAYITTSNNAISNKNIIAI